MQKSNFTYNHSGSGQSPNSFRSKIDPKETAQYIADMVLEMRNMAKASNLTELKDLLELCFYEAFSAANRIAIPDGELDHLRELSKASKAG